MHRSGAVIWVALDADVEAAVHSQSQTEFERAPPVAKPLPAAEPVPMLSDNSGRAGVHILDL
ncbi:hypothetical protein [Sandarakinorhabdus sp.]|uniref:hypothetical protein n=1 Tax=Sandarakinorhabdus sp. TaxID=1916663 RepID=UPI003341664D